jgi:hypothetical protein
MGHQLHIERKVIEVPTNTDVVYPAGGIGGFDRVTEDTTRGTSAHAPGHVLQEQG